MAKVLFFVHVPKCAGMSLTNALRRHLPEESVYQSTSLIANFREGRPDFLELAAPGRLRALIGHWLHEAMLPFLRGELHFATSLREPVARIRSQYRFDMALRAPGWQPESDAAFLARNRNVLCSFILAPFPSVRRAFPTPLDGAKAVLAGMDTLFDMEDASAGQAALLGELGVADPELRRENVSAGRGADWPGPDDELRAAAGDDVALYEWVAEARVRAGGCAPHANPVFDPAARARLEGLRRLEYRPVLLAEYLAGKLARELQVEAEDPDALQARLWRRRIYAEALHEAFHGLRNG